MASSQEWHPNDSIATACEQQAVARSSRLDKAPAIRRRASHQAKSLSHGCSCIHWQLLDTSASWGVSAY